MLARALGKLRARRLVDDHVVRADGAAPASARRIEGAQGKHSRCRPGDGLRGCVGGLSEVA